MNQLEHTISSTALAIVKSQKAKGKKTESDYRSFCESFPTLLRTAGLAQTVAFLRAKKGDTHGEMADNLEQHFRALNILPPDKAQGLLELLTGRQTISGAQYRFYSQIAARVAQWHKRLAQALLEKETKQ
jgi:CRISPR type III-B/RAMP module-associated protein Cmr5